MPCDKRRADTVSGLAPEREHSDTMPWNNGGAEGGSPWGTPPGEGPRPGGRPNVGRADGPRGEGGRNEQGRPGSPWGPPPGGGGGGRGPNGGPPPDLDELIARLQAWLRGLIPPAFGGRRGRFGGRGNRPAFVLIAAVVAAIWLLTGFYRVQPDEQGVVLRFGAFVRTSLPGLNYHLPWPIETVDLPQVTRINRIDIGSAPPASDNSDLQTTDANLQGQNLMLTGDENIIDISFAVFWRISSAPDYLFNTRHPDDTVRFASESVMREVIGRTPIQFALTEGRAQIESDVRSGVQAILDSYGSGVEVTQVQLQRVDPPAAVIDSFRDVQRANTDADRARNEAQAYANDIIPRARGDAAQIVATADAERQATVADATGQTQRFLSVLKSYDAAKDITLQRLYIETMQDVLSHSQALVVDQNLNGVLPFLPLEPHGLPRSPDNGGAK
jgi:membrane protease subunit HflK